MARRLSLLVVLALLITPVLAADLQSRVDEYLQPYVHTKNFQGVVLLARSGDVLTEKGYGFASLEHSVPNTPATVFHIASVSKPFTAAAILQLVEDGKLYLDAPLNEFIPEYSQAEKLTLHHLLAHTSGIPNINAFEEYGDIQLHPQTPESLLGYFKDLPLQFEPGDRYSYSNSNYNLLALAIERASGLSFGDYLGQRVLAPAATRHTAHDGDPAAIIPNRATGYSPTGLFGVSRSPWLDWSAKTGNGSMVATARDLMLWANAFFDNRIVSARSRETMLTEHTPNVGYGWFIRARHERVQYHINGRSPGFSSYVGYYPAEDLTVVVLSNLYNSISTSVGTDLAAIVFGEDYDLPRLTTRPLPAAAATGVAGRFQYGPDFYNPNVVVTLELRDGHVHQLWGDDGFETALIPQGNDQFIDRAFWSEVELLRDDKGNVIKLSFDGFEARRIE